MAGEFGHQSSDRAAAGKLTQAEFDKITAHQFDSQATGDIMYASSATQLSRLGIGSTDHMLSVVSGVPAWMTKSVLLQNLIQTDAFYDIPFHDWSETLVGTGSAAEGPNNYNLNTGATAGGTAQVFTPDNLSLWTPGSSRRVINWDKLIIIHFTFVQLAGTTNGFFRLTLGKDSADGVADLTDHGIGIIIADQAISGHHHTGASASTDSLSSSTTTDTIHRITIVSLAGSMEYFFDGVSKSTSSDGPAGNGSNDHCALQMEVDNGADNASQQVIPQNIKVYAAV